MKKLESDQDPNKKMGASMIIGMWLLILLMLGWFFSGVLEYQQNPNQSVETTLTAQGAKEVYLQRNRAGHYVTRGKINGQVVDFMLDTGATGVVIPAGLQQRLGLQTGRELIVQTANGRIKVYATELDEVSIGDIKLNRVKAMLNPAEHSDTILLGMSFLKHIEFTQRGNELILRQY